MIRGGFEKGKRAMFLPRRPRGAGRPRANLEAPWASRYVVGQTEANSAGSLSCGSPREFASPCCSRLMRS